MKVTQRPDGHSRAITVRHSRPAQALGNGHPSGRRRLGQVQQRSCCEERFLSATSLVTICSYFHTPGHSAFLCRIERRDARHGARRSHVPLPQVDTFKIAVLAHPPFFSPSPFNVVYSPFVVLANLLVGNGKREGSNMISYNAIGGVREISIIFA